MNSTNQLQRIMEKLEDRVLFDAVPDGSLLIEPEDAPNHSPSSDSVHTAQIEQGETQQQPRELILIDANVANSDELLAEILRDRQDRSFEVRLLSADEDGVAQISSLLSEADDAYDSIHVISHGSDGNVRLGSTELNAESLQSYAGEIAGWSDSLSVDADILFYGCQLAATNDGADFLQAMSVLTGADIAASDNLTGHQSLGADWTLEYTTGFVQSEALEASGYFGVLDTFLIRPNTDPITTGIGGIGTTGFWGNAGIVDTDGTIDADGDGDFNNDADIAIDIVATVTDVTGNAVVSFDTVSTVNDLQDDMRVIVTGGGTATIHWEVFEAGTNNRPTEGNVSLTISDIDGAGGVPNSVEGIAASLDNLSAYTVQSPTNLVTSVQDDFLVAQGTENQNDEQPSWVGFTWNSANDLTLTYYTYTTGGRFFNHDGDGDLVFSNPNTNFTQSIDLDADDSSGATGVDYQTVYTDGAVPGTHLDVAVAVADVDITIFDINDAVLEGATITLTNASAGDQLNIDAALLSSLGITGTVNTATPGQVTVTLTGTALVESYETAIQSVTYSNTNVTFDTSYLRQIEITATDGENVVGPATTTVSFATAIQAPAAGPDTYVTQEDTSLAVLVADGLLSNDHDPQNDPLTLISAQDSAGNAISIGSAFLTPSGGSLLLNSDGSLTFTPAANWSGVEYLTYTITDGNGNFATSFATINVAPVVDTPVLSLSVNSVSADEDQLSGAIAITASTPDTDGSETLTVQIESLAVGSTVTDGTNSFTANSGATSIDISAWNLGQIRFQAPTNSDLDQSFRVRVTSAEPNGLSASVTEDVTVSVNAVADAPSLIVTDTNGGTNQTVSLTGNIAVALADQDGSETISQIVISNIPAGAQLLDNGTPLTISGGSVTLTPSQLTNLAFVPPAATNGVFVLNVTAVSEETNPENGVTTLTASTGPVQLTITIDDVDEAVTSHDDVAVAYANTASTIDVISNDEVPDGSPTVVSVDGQSLSAGQTISLVGGLGTVRLNGDGTLDFVAATTTSGTITFTYTVEDLDGDTSTSTVHVSVAPGLVDDVASTNEDTAVTIDVMANDESLAGLLPDTITSQSATDGAFGTTTINPDGTVDYSPNSTSTAQIASTTR